MKRMKTLLVLPGAILAVILVKVIWVVVMTRNIGSFERERDDILQRRNFLLEKVVTSPGELIGAMPAAVGAHFQGEWAIYTTSMFSAALVNTAILYPETRGEAVGQIDSLIRITLSWELRGYDSYAWAEDPLESLDGDKSHISYISLLTWMISGYKAIGGDGKYDALFDRLCATMARRIRKSPDCNLTTFPGSQIFIPDMLAAIAALANYARMNGGRYRDIVDAWVRNMRQHHIDPDTGLIVSVLHEGRREGERHTVLGSYSALNVYYLTFVDEEFAREQYALLKETFLKKRPFTGLRERVRGSRARIYTIDSGPVLFGLSPSGTAFGIGGATYFQDNETRARFLRTGELAGFSVKKKDLRHYLLADIVLVGEAITLAMRTAVPWYGTHIPVLQNNTNAK